jgi:hypothetical protein
LRGLAQAAHERRPVDAAAMADDVDARNARAFDDSVAARGERVVGRMSFGNGSMPPIVHTSSRNRQRNPSLPKPNVLTSLSAIVCMLGAPEPMPVMSSTAL